jgi:carboxymethylenebutenolidase
MDAFLALPEGPGPHPSVLLMHERYGLFQHTKDLAMRFATEGYATICPNLFHRHPKEEQEAILRNEVPGIHTDDSVSSDAAAAIDYLAAVPSANTEHIYAMGVCASGRYPLVLDARRADVAACVCFYGGPSRNRAPVELVIQASTSKTPLLGVFGEADSNHSLDEVLGFRNALEHARRSYYIKIVRDAPHGFLNDRMPGRYRRPQAEAAWEFLMNWLKEVRAGAYAPDRVQWRFESDTSTDYDFTKNVRYE